MEYFIIASSGIFMLLVFLKAVSEINNNHVFKETPYLSWLSIFVWGDALIIGPFWLIAILIWGISGNHWLFLLIASLFFVARSIGEIVYWLNQQFAEKMRNPPEKLIFHNLVKSDAVWFIYQVFWQCIFVFAMIGAIYFGWKWVGSLN